MISHRQADLLPSVKQNQKSFLVRMFVGGKVRGTSTIYVERPVLQEEVLEKDRAWANAIIGEFYNDVINRFNLQKSGPDSYYYQSMSKNTRFTDMMMIIYYIYDHKDVESDFQELGDDPVNPTLEFRLK